MGRISVRTELVGTVPAAEALWYDLRRWPAFVDGFGRVVKAEDGWPAAGGRLVWASRPGGRGQVVERVTSYEERGGQTAEVEDERLRGVQQIRFAEADHAVEILLGLDYRLKQGGPLRAVTDALFIRRALGDSLRRTLARFGRELAADLEPLR
jgi:hypothetical protein